MVKGSTVYRVVRVLIGLTGAPFLAGSAHGQPSSVQIQLAALRSPQVQEYVRAPGFRVVSDAQDRPEQRLHDSAFAAAVDGRVATETERVRCAERGACKLLPRGTKTVTVDQPLMRGDTARVVVGFWFTSSRAYAPHDAFLGGAVYTLDLRQRSDGLWFVFRVKVAVS